MSKTIVLTGMKHCGKSTQGRMLAEKLHRNFIDADDVIEQIYARKHNEKLSCREIFRKHGETFFRKLEAEAVQFMMDNNDNQQIIAFGGGAVANPFMPENWRSLGVVVYLAANPLVLYQRIEGRGLPHISPANLNRIRSSSKLPQNAKRASTLPQIRYFN